MCQVHATGDFLFSRSAFAGNYVRHVHFAGVNFLISQQLTAISASRSAIPTSLSGSSLPRQDKLSCLIEWYRLTLVLYQSHFPSRLACGIGIGLPSFDVQSFSRRKDTGFIGTNPSGNGVLASRQVAAVMSALGKGSHVFAID